MSMWSLSCKAMSVKTVASLAPFRGRTSKLRSSRSWGWMVGALTLTHERPGRWSSGWNGAASGSTRTGSSRRSPGRGRVVGVAVVETARSMWRLPRPCPWRAGASMSPGLRSGRWTSRFRTMASVSVNAISSWSHASRRYRSRRYSCRERVGGVEEDAVGSASVGRFDDRWSVVARPRDRRACREPDGTSLKIQANESKRMISKVVDFRGRPVRTSGSSASICSARRHSGLERGQRLGQVQVGHVERPGRRLALADSTWQSAAAGVVVRAILVGVRPQWQPTCR